jgi:hypothetical protein
MPLVRQDHWHSGTYDFTDPSVLLPGASPDLDRLAEVLLGERPLYRPPTDADRERSTEAEDAVIEALRGQPAKGRI